MKKTLLARIALAVVLLLLTFGTASSNKMAILNFNKGEMTDDNNNTIVLLSEENTEKEGDYSLKMEFSERSKKSWSAVLKPKKDSWSGFTKVKIDVFNPENKDLKLGGMIKGVADTRKDWPVTLKPGKNEVEVKIADVFCNDGRTPLDINKISMWAFLNLEERPITVFILKLYLEDDNK